MVKNDRMGGYVPKWEIVSTPQQTVEKNLSLAQSGQTPQSGNALAYHQDAVHSPAGPEEEFTFGDLVDMVNPLHHIPLVGHAYRSITGDEIKPISQIVGGAILGGPAGAASGLVNAVIQEETGKDIAGHAIAMAGGGGDSPALKTPPERQLDQALEIARQHEDLSNALLAFTDMGAADIVIEKNRKPGREPITQVSLSPPSGLL